MKILDLSAGFRHIWFDKENPLVTFLDRRPEVKPDFICDTRKIPPEVGSDFDLIVFDPPHENTGTGKMSETYGTTNRAEILSTIKETSKGAWTIAKPGALLCFKWNDTAWPLEKILPLFSGWSPLFGHGMRLNGRHRTQTYWVLFRRLEDPGT